MSFLYEYDSASKLIYVAYGVNIYSKNMLSILPSAIFRGVGELKNWRLVFRKRFRAGAIATIERFEGGVVPVAYWEIDKADEPTLDVAVGFPRYLAKRLFDIEIDVEPLTAIMFCIKDTRVLGCPTAQHIGEIREGYEECGFDLEILNAAERFSIRGSSLS